MKTNLMLKWLTAGTVFVALILVNIAIFHKEQLLETGTLVIMELAPVDPRSLMQGDYMALDYALTRGLSQTITDQEQILPNGSGTLVVELDEHHRATQAHFTQQAVLKPHQVLMKYRRVNHRVQIGTPSYFFEEGQAERFEHARYGEFRVSDDGTAVLTYLLDKEGKRIEP